DGSSILFAKDTSHGSRVVLQSLATGDRTVILKRAVGSGRLFVWSASMSPHASQVVFCGQVKSNTHLYTIRVDGSGLAEVPSTKGFCFADWSVTNQIVA